MDKCKGCKYEYYLWIPTECFKCKYDANKEFINEVLKQEK